MGAEESKVNVQCELCDEINRATSIGGVSNSSVANDGIRRKRVLYPPCKRSTIPYSRTNARRGAA